MEAEAEVNVSSLTCWIISVGLGLGESLIPEEAWAGHRSDFYLAFLRHQPPGPKV